MRRTGQWILGAGLALAFTAPTLADKGGHGRGGGNPHTSRIGTQGPSHPVGLERAREVGKGKKKGLDRAEQNQARHDARRESDERQKQRRRQFMDAQRAERERFRQEMAQLPQDQRKEREREFHRKQKEAYKDFKEQESRHYAKK